MSSKQENVYILDRQEQQGQQGQEICDKNVDLDNQDNNLEDEQIDELLEEQNEKETKQQIVLRFKVNQLQKICNSLTSTNRKLIDKVTSLEQQKQKYELDRYKRFPHSQDEEGEGECSSGGGEGDSRGGEGDGRQGNMKKDSEQNIFVDEYSELNNEFMDIEQLIQQYKRSLTEFQKNVLLDIKNKDQKHSKLKKDYKQLSEQYQKLQQQKQDIQKLNKQLQTRNQGLILEIQNLEKQKIILEDKASQFYNYQHYQHFHNSHSNLHSPSNFHSATPSIHNPSNTSNIRYMHASQYQLPVEIQNQYEILIDKLVKELEYEKNIKRKMGDEIKRMSQELMQSERQIMSKNKKLYEIQMKLLRSSKTTADSSVNYSKIKNQDIKLYFSHRQDPLPTPPPNPNLNPNANNNKNNSHPNNIPKNDQKLNLKSFILLQLINMQLEEEVSNSERKIIGLKIIQFYERKMQRQDYSNVNPQNLLVSNFNHRKYDLISIKKVGTSAYEEGEKTQESLVWNLAFILDNLFGQNQGIQDFDEILEITGQILEKQFENNKETLQCMKEILCL